MRYYVYKTFTDFDMQFMRRDREVKDTGNRKGANRRVTERRKSSITQKKGPGYGKLIRLQ